MARGLRLHVWLALAAAAGGGGIVRGQWQTYETTHYIVRTDLGPDCAREANLRTEVLFDAYLERTRAPKLLLEDKLELWLFRNHTEYVARGGRHTGGVYNGSQLLVYFGTRIKEHDWAAVQHEATHQFVHKVLQGNVPLWANEGLACYFGNALFTGDSYVFGHAPEDAVEDVKGGFNNNTNFKPLAEFMQIDGGKWSQDMEQSHRRSGRNYLQAWSLVYFLMHADNGRYRPAFETCLRDAGRGESWQACWTRQFTADARVLDAAWRNFWRNQPRDPTHAVYAEAIARTLTVYLARASAQGQRFATAADFFAAAQGGLLRQASADWLPPALVFERVQEAMKLGSWTLQAVGPRLELVCSTNKDLIAAGTFELKDGRVENLRAKVVSKSSTSRPLASP